MLFKIFKDNIVVKYNHFLNMKVEKLKKSVVVLLNVKNNYFFF